MALRSAAPEASDEWQPLGDETMRLRDELDELDQRLVPRAEDAAASVSAELLRQLPDGPAALLPLVRAAAEAGNPTYGEISAAVGCPACFIKNAMTA